ncbi:MAG: hypothetical protein WB756_23480 [Xanthobacteraceae bacterium]
MSKQFELPTRANRTAEEGVFDDGFGIRSKVRFDRRVARVREAENRQFGTFCLRGSERKLGQAALDRSEMPLGVRQAGWIQAISDEVAAQPTIVAEVGNRYRRVTGLLEGRRELGRLDAASQNDRGIRPVRTCPQHTRDRGGSISEQKKGRFLLGINERNDLWRAVGIHK